MPVGPPPTLTAMQRTMLRVLQNTAIVCAGLAVTVAGCLALQGGSQSPPATEPKSPTTPAPYIADMAEASRGTPPPVR